MQSLVLSWWLLFAVIPQYQDFYPNGGYVDYAEYFPIYENTIGVDATFGPFRVWTEADSLAKKAPDGPFFAPFSVDYRVGLELNYGPVTLGAEHNCLHPVESTRSYTDGFAQNKTRFFARIKVKSKD